jgi:hypothetical protein
MLRALLTAFTLAAAAPAPATAPAATTSEQVVRAAQSGDRALMERLKGARVTLKGRPAQAGTLTGDLREFVLVTGPDFKLAGGASGFEVVLRVPAKLTPPKLPELIDAAGTIAGFEEPAHEEGVPGRVAWRPIIAVDFLK